jgi:hypothetical protein
MATTLGCLIDAAIRISRVNRTRNDSSSASSGASTLSA